MKNPIKIILLFCFILLLNNDSNAQWLQTNGPTGGFIKCTAASGTHLFAGTLSGLYRSSNNGAAWTEITNTLGAYPIADIVVLGSDIFVTNGIVYRSTNNGDTWEETTSGITNAVSALAINGNTIYAGSNGQIFISTDHGVSWAAHGSFTAPNNFIESITSIGSNNLFAAGQFLVYRSTNNGANWSSASSGLTGNSMESITAIGNTLFVGGYGGVFTSTNSGTSWTSALRGRSSRHRRTVCQQVPRPALH